MAGKKDDGAPSPAAKPERRRATNDLGGLLTSNDNGTIHPTVINAANICRHDPMLKGCFGYNEFAEDRHLLKTIPAATRDGPVPRGPFPRQWSDTDVTAVLCYVQRTYAIGFKAPAIEAAMASAADSYLVHPVREWLASLKWEGQPRLDRWLYDCFGAKLPDEPTISDHNYIRDVGAKTLIGAVRRIRQPGCKHDTILVLGGPQGAGKSSCLRELFTDAWFTDDFTSDIRSKDASQNCLGVWCVEFAEIEHLIRHEVETIKAFLSRAVERYRPPYGRTVIQRPRQCIFFGTTNKDDYLKDGTGNRRIWPVQCSKADEQWIKENRVQLWAEAAHREARGEQVWIDHPDTLVAAMVQQGLRVAEDSWATLVRNYLSEEYRAEVEGADVLRIAIGIQTSAQDRKNLLRLGDVMRAFGWTRENRREDGTGRQRKVWVNPIKDHQEYRRQFPLVIEHPDDWVR